MHSFLITRFTAGAATTKVGWAASQAARRRTSAPGLWRASPVGQCRSQQGTATPLHSLPTAQSTPGETLGSVLSKEYSRVNFRVSAQ